MQIKDDMIKMQARCISHEIRNQLSISDVYCEIIKKHLEKNGVSIPSVDNALNCIKKATKMIGNSLLDLKALNNYDMKCCDLDNLLEQGVELSKVYISDKTIDILLESNLKVCISVDENKFLACILNLIKNAIEAIELKGFVKISTCLDGDFVCIKFANNGEKIPDAFLDKIFTIGETSKCYGSGLGLYICKSNLQSMGADLALVSSNDDITIFEIRYPVNKI